MVDWTKPIQTKSGWKAELLCVLKKLGPFTHVVKLTEPNGDEYASHFKKCGQYNNCMSSEIDIINVPETTSKTVWLALWNDGEVTSGAGPFVRPNVIANRRIEVTFTHGVFED